MYVKPSFEINSSTTYTVGLVINMRTSQTIHISYMSRRQNENIGARRMSSDQEGFNCAGIRHPSSTIGWSRNGGILGSFPLPWLLLLLIVAMITLNVVSASGSRTPQRASATDMDHPLHVTWEDVTFEVAKTSSSDANR